MTTANFCNSEGYKKNELKMTAKKSQINNVPLHPALGDSRYKQCLKLSLDKPNGAPFSNMPLLPSSTTYGTTNNKVNQSVESDQTVYTYNSIESICKA